MRVISPATARGSLSRVLLFLVTQIIMAKPAGGPKPPAQGGRDED